MPPALIRPTTFFPYAGYRRWNQLLPHVTICTRILGRGQRLGKVSDDFGGSPTSIHLHFEIRANVALPGQPAGFRKVPPYTSLVDSYKRLLKGQP